MRQLHRSLLALWYAQRPSPWALRALRALAALFGAAVRLRRAAYAHGLLRSQQIGRPVIVVGNITVGGSGKTPLVVWLCEQLREQGLRPGIVLRGYGRALRQRQAQLVRVDSDTVAVGDEAVLLARRTRVPVVVGRDRVRAARRLIEEDVDVVLADDGLQHLRLARHFEIAVIDATRGLGNGRLLPAGPLREPAGRLGQVDALVLNADPSEASRASPDWNTGVFGAGAPPRFTMRLQGDWLWPLAGSSAGVPLLSFAGRAVHALAGIGNPERFFQQLRCAGLRVIPHAFPDHHRYRPQELQFADALPVLMTEKDAVKCHAFGVSNCWFLPVAVAFADAQAAGLRERLMRAVTHAGIAAVRPASVSVP